MTRFIFFSTCEYTQEYCRWQGKSVPKTKKALRLYRAEVPLRIASMEAAMAERAMRIAAMVGRIPGIISMKL
jgi:hypothetical protein